MSRAEPVDVLAVYDRLLREVPMGAGHMQNIVAARAAIAELIEAAREASGTLGHVYHTTPLSADLEQHAHDGSQRLDAAIDRVGGGK